MWRSLILLALTAQAHAVSGPEALKRLQEKLRVQLVEPAVLTDLAGHYTGQPRELVARVGPPLSGEDLYLFPDGSFLFSQWADIMPTTVFDKGKWTFSEGVLELHSDTDIRWDPEIARRHLAVRREGRRGEIMLVGLPRELDYFEEQTGRDPELMLLIVAMARAEVLTVKTAPALKAKLMKEAWNPGYFRNGP